MDLPAHITTILTPDLGANTADAVARHLCAKHNIDANGSVDPAKALVLKDTIRRGLVAFVGAERAEVLSARCFEDVL